MDKKTILIKIIKMAILPKLICIFKAIPIKMPKIFLKVYHKVIIKFIWRI